MKNVNIMGAHQFLGEGGESKIYMGNCLKMGLGNLQKAKNKEIVLEGDVDTSMHAMT